MGKESESDEPEVPEGQGLMGGITAYHIRLLCESGLDGGGGYEPRQVGQWSLDQIWFRLVDKGILKQPIGNRTATASALHAIGAVKPDKDGLLAGRDRDGNPIKGRVRGVSVARQLMNAKKARDAKQRKDKPNGTRIG